MGERSGNGRWVGRGGVEGTEGDGKGCEQAAAGGEGREQQVN